MERYHFIGIGGIGMSSLASILLDRGATVTGTDLSLNERTDFLQKKGALIHEGHDARWVHPDATVVYHARISKTHPELIQGNKTIHRLDLLKQTVGELPIYAVVGAHGKTSTAALLAHVLSSFDSKFGFSVGGVLCNSLLNGKDGEKGFAIEGDESDGSFLRIGPTGAILTNVDPDHLDFWDNFDLLKKGYRQFIEGIYDPTLLFYAVDEDQELVEKGVSYGIGKGAIQAYDLRAIEEGTVFSIIDQRTQETVLDLFLPLFGEHQVKNALGVYGLCRRLGVPTSHILEAFRSYLGVKRRCELMGDFMGAKVFCDYGHHPAELKATFQGLKKHHLSKMTVVFEPHKFSRTKSFFSEFVEVLSSADELILLETYPATESYDFEGSSEKLALALGKKVVKTTELRKDLESRGASEGVLLFIGAGTIDRTCAACLFSKD
ncbi:MAG: UDP-N-acetylmuramate--L-alanine ligase [Chlamydiia bacterium]